MEEKKKHFSVDDKWVLLEWLVAAKKERPSSSVHVEHPDWPKTRAGSEDRVKAHLLHGQTQKKDRKEYGGTDELHSTSGGDGSSRRGMWSCLLGGTADIRVSRDKQ